jgi:hypothetical protein
MINFMNTKAKVQAEIVLILAVIIFMGLPVIAQKKNQQTFSAPEDAVVALVDAVKANDTASLAAILGPDAKSALSSGDELADRRGRDLFVAAYFQLASLSGDDATKTLYIGSEEWPFPIPIIKISTGWHFDTSAGIEELIYRRIGRNELSTIDTCLSYYAAQNEYAEKSHDGNPVGTYAQKFLSTAGKQDGLYWKVSEGEELSPLGEFAAEAEVQGYTHSPGKLTPFHGYYFHVITAQGTLASGGARSYIVNGLMRGGFALVAYPAEYGKGEVMTFIVSHNGVVYEKDLGELTAKLAAVITQFDPGDGWAKVEQATKPPQ